MGSDERQAERTDQELVPWWEEDPRYSFDNQLAEIHEQIAKAKEKGEEVTVWEMCWSPIGDQLVEALKKEYPVVIPSVVRGSIRFSEQDGLPAWDHVEEFGSIGIGWINKKGETS